MANNQTDIAFRDTLAVLLVKPDLYHIGTSLAFGHAMDVGLIGGCTTFIRSEPINELPYAVLDKPVQPPVHMLRKVEFLYLENRSDFIDFTVGLPELGGVPDTVCIDGLHRYCTDNDVYTIHHLASLLALLHDLGLWIEEKRRQTVGLAPILCVFKANSNEHDQLAALCMRYTRAVWKIDGSGSDEFQMTGSQADYRLCVSDKRIVTYTDSSLTKTV